ncbi:MAG TPA: hypothetical protein VMW33_00460 [Ilumatobacteraceae bacterium]|nr:hypothetical protein [Ilumatobacteraceae bacterium]
MSSATLVDGKLTDGMLFDATLFDGTLFDGVVTEGTLFDGTLFDGVVTDGTLFEGVLFDGVVTDGTGAGVGAGTTTEMQSGSEACSASSQLPRTSPGTPLSSGVPASRAAAIVGTATVSAAKPAMIQVRCRFMGSSSLWGMPP